MATMKPNENKAIINKRIRLWQLRREMRKERRQLRILQHETQKMANDYANRLNLPKGKSSKEYLALLRPYENLNRHLAGGPTRVEWFLGESYDFAKKIVSHWTLKDVNDLLDLLCHSMHLTRQQAIAKMLVDQAHDYVLLYEYFCNLPNDFAKVMDREGRPTCIPKRVMEECVWWSRPYTQLAVWHEPITAMQKLEGEQFVKERVLSHG